MPKNAPEVTVRDAEASDRKSGRTGGALPTTPADASAVTPRQEERRQRLVVELSTAAAEELQYLTDREELNKTTIVNRALQVYAILRRAEDEGSKVLIQEPDWAVQQIRFV